MPQVKDIYLESKYPAIQYLICALCAMSALSILYGGYVFVKSDEKFTITVLIGSLVFSIMLLVGAQILSVIKDIEWNQRELIELKKQQIEATKE